MTEEIINYYCDVCGKKVKEKCNISGRVKCSFDWRTYEYELCEDCERSVVTFIEKKQKENGIIT